MRTLSLLLSVVLLAVAAEKAGAAGLAVPVPDIPGYNRPDTENPAPRAEWREALDLGALAAGLTLATYFALVRRSRRGLFLLAIASLAWLGFWRKGCICPIGAIQNVALALADPQYAIPGTVAAFFVLPLVFTLFFGRTFCAAVCPLGAVQELVALRPVRVPTWLDHALGLVAYIYLGLGVLLAATGTAFLICRYDPFVRLFRLGDGTGMLLFAAGFLVVGIFIGRPYCRYLCPYGAILGVLSRLSRWHVQIPPTDCIQCRLCEDSCPYGAIREPTVVQPAGQRGRGRRRLVVLAALLPVLVGLGALVGRQLDVPLSLLHPQVALAEEVHQEEVQERESGKRPVPSDAARAFAQRSGGGQEGRDKLYLEASEIRNMLRQGGGWFGAWVGLVVGVKLLHLSVRRRRTDYQPDRTSCVSCGRCFWYCPSEQARQGWVEANTLGQGAANVS